ncbi:MAG TPA: HD-GYP domain-containing protein [Candidatus Gastranaerophilales bacterium]|nr:HD-GYP domain-containing protein [Candidatus Gastranaerophilales bacterium]
MRQVIALELVGLKKLDCDLYDENGKIIYRRGTEFTPEIFMMLSYTKLFKRDEESLVLNNVEILEEEIKKPKRSYYPDEEEQISKKPKLPDTDYDISQNRRSGDVKRSIAHTNSLEQTFDIIKKIEPPNIEKDKEFKSVIDEEKKQTLIKGVKEILYGALNAIPVGAQPCMEVTDNILNEVYTKLRAVNNFNELRVHDYYTFSHSLNVAIISAVIGRELGFNENKLKDLTFSAFLHDIGKMRVPKNILYKPGMLTLEEMQIIKKHSQLGYDYIVETLGLPKELAKPALEHHERWEGTGYPNGLKGNQISEFAQIVAIADVYDAMVSEKIYRGSVKSIDAMRIMLTEESKSFNPLIVNKFVYMAVIKADIAV